MFSKGGFVAVAPSLAAYVLRIPVVTHECDTVSGLANRITALFATKQLTTFPNTSGVLVGNPLRPQIAKANAEFGKHFLGFADNSLPIVMVIGGSQGSAKINQTIAEHAVEITKHCNLVVVTGGQATTIQDGDRIRTYPYLHKEYLHVLAAADIIVSRAGSNSIFELAALQKAMILVPLASSAGNHQFINAEYFVQQNAAFLVQENQIKNILPGAISRLLTNEDLRHTLATSASKLHQPNAPEKIADQILSVAKK